jgi:mannose-6-phosphate isomerase-like protein (cupin superfamily)
MIQEIFWTYGLRGIVTFPAGKIVQTGLPHGMTGRPCAREFIEPGPSVGYHKHEGYFELYYVLEGEGLVHDNGFETTIRKGDVVRTGNGEFHSIKNAGDTNLELIAIILYE